MPHYCSSPFNSIWVDIDGYVKTCCAGSYHLGNLFENTLDEILYGSKLTVIQQEIQAGKIPEYCSACVKSEELIGISQRNYYKQFTDTNCFTLKSVDIRWNETCNIACTYCNEKFSSKWAKKKTIPISVKKPYHTELLSFLINNAANIEAVMLAGGEPLMHKEMLPFIQSLPSSTQIDVLTNLGVDFSEYRYADELLRRKALFNVSLENTGPHCEYVRNGIEWKTVLDNMAKVKERTGQITLLSLYNIFSCTKILDLVKFAHSQNAAITWQNLTWPHYLQVFKFSDKVKLLAIDELDRCIDYLNENHMNNGTTEFVKTTKQSLLNSMGTIRTVDRDFRRYITEFEEKYNSSNHKFSELWPELWSVVHEQ
jgi:MoaA/NifB/PqqE/SkfB family radical SAM enzyme